MSAIVGRERRKCQVSIRMRSLVPALAIAAALLLLTGCAGKSTNRWYREGSGQAEFDRDVQECLVLSEEIGRQATLTGRRPDLEARAKAYNQCLFARGWSHVPVQKVSNEEGPGDRPPLLMEEQGRIRFGSRDFPLPEGFALGSSDQWVSGPSQMQRMSFQGPGQVYLTLVAQENKALAFEQSAFPVGEQFSLYDRGKTGMLQWTAFHGPIREAWVAGLGFYLLASPTDRLTVVLTSTLPGQESPPPKGLILSAEQHARMELFLEQWLAWLEAVDSEMGQKRTIR
jgi:hypothetical protein